MLRGTELMDEASPDCVSFATNEKKRKKKRTKENLFISICSIPVRTRAAFGKRTTKDAARIPTLLLPSHHHYFKNLLLFQTYFIWKLKWIQCNAVIAFIIGHSIGGVGRCMGDELPKWLNCLFLWQRKVASIFWLEYIITRWCVILQQKLNVADYHLWLKLCSHKCIEYIFNIPIRNCILTFRDSYNHQHFYPTGPGNEIKKTAREKDSKFCSVMIKL